MFEYSSIESCNENIQIFSEMALLFFYTAHIKKSWYKQSFTKSIRQIYINIYLIKLSLACQKVVVNLFKKSKIIYYTT